MKWNPEDYAKNSSAQVVWATELIGRLHLRGTESIMDMGCGDGKITQEFADAVPEGYVLGIDNNWEFIAYANKHHSPSQFSNLEFRQMDFRLLTADRQFDLIFSNAALHWVADHCAVLKGCSHLLRSGGRLVISCGGKGNAVEIMRAADEVIASPQWQKYFEGFIFPYSFYSPEDYQPWLQETDLRPIRLELVPKDMIHEGREGLAGWIRTTWIPYLSRIPEPLQKEFVDDIVTRYLQQYPLDLSGRTHVRMIRLEVEAIKDT